MEIKTTNANIYLKSSLSTLSSFSLFFRALNVKHCVENKRVGQGWKQRDHSDPVQQGAEWVVAEAVVRILKDCVKAWNLIEWIIFTVI